jgi:hypothetical protein
MKRALGLEPSTAPKTDQSGRTLILVLFVVQVTDKRPHKVAKQNKYGTEKPMRSRQPGSRGAAVFPDLASNCGSVPDCLTWEQQFAAAIAQ